MTLQVTINDVCQAVQAALEAAFPDVPVTVEEHGHHLAPPYFYVKLLVPEQTQELGRRFMRRHPFDVQYVAQNPQNADMYDIAEQLTSVLQRVEVAGRPVRGTGMRVQIIEGDLHFFVEYNFHVWAPRPDDPAMGTIDVQEGLK